MSQQKSRHELTALIIGILATWRFASLLFREGGPWQLFDHFRAFFHVGKNATGDTVCVNERSQVCKMLSCFWCTSVWAALGIQLAERRLSIPRLLAYSAGAIFLGFIGARIDPDQKQPERRRIRVIHADGIADSMRNLN